MTMTRLGGGPLIAALREIGLAITHPPIAFDDDAPLHEALAAIVVAIARCIVAWFSLTVRVDGASRACIRAK